MSEKKELHREQLEQVVGGVSVGDHRIVMCEVCGTQFDPDASQRGDDVVERSKDGLGEVHYATLLCPQCQEFRRFSVIQLKPEDRKIHDLSAIAN